MLIYITKILQLTIQKSGFISNLSALKFKYPYKVVNVSLNEIKLFWFTKPLKGDVSRYLLQFFPVSFFHEL